MPTWDPPPDVRFDHTAAQALAATALDAERELDRLVQATRRLHEVAAATWRGRARARADDHLERWWFAIAGAIDDLRALAAQVAAATAAAQAEQARRSAERIRWHAEAEAERQAEARAPRPDDDGGDR
ncbi:MAG: hypothetical protein ACE367_19365 [Acidimicrobiales bacterium]